MNHPRYNELKEAIRKYSYKENYEEPFQLASGKTSNWYFDLKQILLRPETLRIVGELMCAKMKEVLRNYPRAMAGLTMGSDPVIYAASLFALEEKKEILPLVIRKENKDHGSKKRIEGLLSNVGDENIVLVDDVITTGMSTLKALDALELEGRIASEAFCVLDRMEGGFENLAARGVKMYSLFTLDDFRTQKP